VDPTGRRYYLDRAPKQGGFTRLPDGTVVLRGGFRPTVEDEDEEAFYYRVYEAADDPRASDDVESDPDEAARIEASYRFNLAEVDRLRLTPFANGLPRRGQWRNGFEIADMNADGWPDIVHGPERKGQRAPNIFLGDGKGSWRKWEVSFPRLAYDYGDVAVADFDGDGRLDIALAMHLTGLVVIVQRSPGEFSNWGEGLPTRGREPGRGSFTSRAVEAGDWNGDGRPDLLALGEGPVAAMGQSTVTAPAPASYDLAVYLNGGDGTWSELREQPARVTHGNHLAVSDLDGDGRTDAVLAASVVGHRRLLRLGREGDRWDAIELEGVRPRGVVGAVAVDDLDTDGKPDILVGYIANESGTWRTGVDLFVRRGTGWERRVLFNEASRAGVTAVASGDADGDGHRDVVVLGGDGRRWMFLGSRGGAFELERSTPAEDPGEIGCQGYDVALADVDRDGRDDLIEEFAGELSAMFAPTACQDMGGLAVWRSVAAGATP
jgi:hypothetical protein